MQFLRYVDALWAMGVALLAPDAIAGLTQLGHAPVITYQVGPASLTVVLVARAIGHVALVHALIVVQQDRGDIDAIRAGHAILAIVARDGRVGHHQLGRLLEKRQLVVAQRHEGRIGPDVILQVLHIGHAAQDGQHLRGRAGETEGPRGDAALRHPLLQAEHDVLRHV